MSPDAHMVRVLKNLLFLLFLQLMTNMERIIVGSSTVTRRGQITIPKDLRKKYEITNGDIIYFIELNGDLLIKRGPIKL